MDVGSQANWGAATYGNSSRCHRVRVACGAQLVGGASRAQGRAGAREEGVRG